MLYAHFAGLTIYKGIWNKTTSFPYRLTLCQLHTLEFSSEHDRSYHETKRNETKLHTLDRRHPAHTHMKALALTFTLFLLLSVANSDDCTWCQEILRRVGEYGATPIDNSTWGLLGYGCQVADAECAYFAIDNKEKLEGYVQMFYHVKGSLKDRPDLACVRIGFCKNGTTSTLRFKQ